MLRCEENGLDEWIARGAVAPSSMKNNKRKEKKKKKKKGSNGKSKNKSSCGEVFADDLIACEILARLPVKSLFRFKCVCKKWNHIISHCPSFRASHVEKGPNRTNFAGSCYLYPSQTYDFSKFKTNDCVLRVFSTNSNAMDYEFNLPAAYVRNVWGSTGGLIYGSSSRHVFICNPFTKQVTYIPTDYDSVQMFDTAIAYDPCKDPNSFAIVALVELQSYSNWYTFKVYSSLMREWRVSNENVSVSSSYHLRTCRPAFSRGKMYWSVVWQILWFDIEEDSAGLIQCPNDNHLVFIDPIQKPWFGDLGVCNGKGGELSYNMLTKEGNIEIWLLRGDEQKKFEWERRFVVRLPEIVQRNWKFMKRYFNPMKVWNRDALAKSLVRRQIIFPLPYAGGELVWFLVQFKNKLNKYDVVYSINMRTQEFNFIDNDLLMNMHPFIPTLSFPA